VWEHVKVVILGQIHKVKPHGSVTRTPMLMMHKYTCRSRYFSLCLSLVIQDDSTYTFPLEWLSTIYNIIQNGSLYNLSHIFVLSRWKNWSHWFLSPILGVAPILVIFCPTTFIDYLRNKTIFFAVKILQTIFFKLFYMLKSFKQQKNHFNWSLQKEFSHKLTYYIYHHGIK